VEEPVTIQLNGKNVLLTGGTRGIGRAIATMLADAGANLVVCYRQDADAAESLALRLKSVGDNSHVVQADLTSPAEIAGLVEECRTRLGSLDVVVHNAGAISHVPFGELALDEWHRVLDTNLTAAFLLTQHALGLLGSGGSIVYLGSKVATVGVPLRAHYTAAKAGLLGLSRSLAKELGRTGIRVNVVAPGVIDTAEAAKLPPEHRTRYESMTALGRLGRPEEVAAAVLFLASDLSSYLTGETLTVDGGIS